MTAQNPVTETFAPVAASVAAYDQCKTELEEAAKQPLAPLTANVAYAVRVMLTVAGNVEKYMPALKELGIADADKLAMRANALSYAQALHDWTLNSPQKVEVLAAEVVNARRLLTTELDLVVVRGLIAHGAIKLQTTGSYLGMAQDVRVICSAFLANWDKVGPEIGNDQAHVHEALRDADNLIAAIAKAAEVQETLKGTALMRAAAWTLARKCYDGVHRGIQFLRYEEGDVDEIVPSIYDTRPKKKNEKPSDAPLETVTPPVAPAPPVNGPAGAPIGPIVPSNPFQ